MRQRFLLSIFLFFGMAIKAQKVLLGLDSLAGTVINALNVKSYDKIFLTSDKRFYKASERIWFRGFVVNAVTNKISTKNKIVYVDIVNDRDQSMGHNILNAGRQHTSGSLYISDSIPTGNYWLRAYTKQMTLTDTLNSAVLSIYIFNPKKSEETSHKLDSSENIPIIDIFPEGGTLITATENIVTIYAHTRKGKPLLLKAFLIDNRSKDSIPIVTNIYGYGNFTIIPNRFKNYTLITNYNGKDNSFTLPPYDFWGAKLAIKNKENDLLLIRTVLEDSLNKINNTTFLIGIHKGTLWYVNVGNGSYQTNISYEKLPKGLITFLLYNYKYDLLSERSIYINKPEEQVAISTDKQIYKKRDNAKASLSINDENGHSLTSSVCISVIDSLTQKMTETVQNEELLQPYPILSIDEWALMHLQNLNDSQMNQILICQPSLVKNLKSKPLLPLNPDSLIYISGLIVKTKNNPLAHQSINLFSDSKNGAFFSDSTDENGRFSIPLKEITDSSVYWLELNNPKNNKIEIAVKMDTISVPLFKTPRILKYYISPPLRQLVTHLPSYQYNLTFNEENKLKEVIVRTELKKPLDYDVTEKVSRNSFVLTPTIIHRAGTSFIGNALRMVPGLQVLNGYVILGGLNDMRGPNKNAEPLVLVDGVQVFLMDPPPAAAYESPVLYYFNTLNANDIDFIEVLKGAEASQYGLRGGNGVIYIHSAKRNFDNFSQNKSTFIKLYTPGFTKQIFFTNPDYTLSYFKEANSDKRVTLYWTGNELIDTSTKHTISFYTSDNSGLFYIELTALTEHGEFLYKKVKLQVE